MLSFNRMYLDKPFGFSVYDFLYIHHIYLKNDINIKPRKGGLLGFASGVAALVAMKTQSEDFPIFMI